MSPIEEDLPRSGSEAIPGPLPITPRERFVTGVYAAVDAAVALELARLQAEAGTVPSCSAGCSHCCWGLVRTNMAEAHTLGQYVKRTFSAAALEDLRFRTQQWHQRENVQRGRPQAADPGEWVDLSAYEPSCPLLVDDRCSAYPVRPIMCRTHYVSTPPSLCEAAMQPASTLAAPVVLTTVVASAVAEEAELRAHVEQAGLDYSQSIMLLPHGLAIELGWDFAIDP